MASTFVAIVVLVVSLITLIFGVLFLNDIFNVTDDIKYGIGITILSVAMSFAVGFVSSSCNEPKPKPMTNQKDRIIEKKIKQQQNLNKKYQISLNDQRKTTNATMDDDAVSHSLVIDYWLRNSNVTSQREKNINTLIIEYCKAVYALIPIKNIYSLSLYGKYIYKTKQKMQTDERLSKDIVEALNTVDFNVEFVAIILDGVPFGQSETLQPGFTVHDDGKCIAFTINVKGKSANCGIGVEGWCFAIKKGCGFHSIALKIEDSIIQQMSIDDHQ